MLDLLKREQTRKWLVLVTATLSVTFLFAAWFQPMWGWYLSAPQYPDGLTLSIYMDRVEGDVTEINILNHYIGMAHLEEAAQLERSLAAYGLVAISLMTLLMVFLPGRRYARLFALPAFIFPFIFVAAMYRWMYRFGHQLSPDAPVTVEPFTPTLAGSGQIGNFSTIGMPGAGFYLVLGASVCVVLTYLLRRKVCDVCPFYGDCKILCTNHLLQRRRTRADDLHGDAVPEEGVRGNTSGT